MKLKKAFIIFGLSLMTALTVSVKADAIEPNSVTTMEVVFDSNTEFTIEEQKIIRAHFIGNDDIAQSYGLKCTLFGHDYKTEIVTVITPCGVDRHYISVLNTIGLLDMRDRPVEPAVE